MILTFLYIWKDRQNCSLPIAMATLQWVGDTDVRAEQV